LEERAVSISLAIGEGMSVLSYWLNCYKLIRGLYRYSEIVWRDVPVVWDLNLLAGQPKNYTWYVYVEDSDCATGLVCSHVFLV
jgi:hypothetical protein